MNRCQTDYVAFLVYMNALRSRSVLEEKFRMFILSTSVNSRTGFGDEYA